MKKLLMLMVVFVLVVLVGAQYVVAQEPIVVTGTVLTSTVTHPYPGPIDPNFPQDINTIPGFFAFLASGAAGVLLSEWLRKNEKYQELPTDTKRSIAWGLPILSALLGKAMIDFVPQEFITALAPYWHYLWVGIFAAAAANLKYRMESK